MTFPHGFAPDPKLTGPTVSLTPLTRAELPEIAKAASDPLIWAMHPARDRYLPDIFASYGAFLLSAGGTLVARQKDRVVGISRFYPAPDHDPSIAIGFTFLIRAVWGGDTNAEMKALMLEYAFGHTDEVWFHIAPDNLRSRAATAKLGATERYEARLAIGGPASPTACYAVTRAEWRRSPAAAASRAAGLTVPE